MWIPYIIRVERENLQSDGFFRVVLVQEWQLKTPDFSARVTN